MFIIYNHSNFSWIQKGALLLKKTFYFYRFEPLKFWCTLKFMNFLNSYYRLLQISRKAFLLILFVSFLYSNFNSISDYLLRALTSPFSKKIKNPPWHRLRYCLSLFRGTSIRREVQNLSRATSFVDFFLALLQLSKFTITFIRHNLRFIDLR